MVYAAALNAMSMEPKMKNFIQDPPSSCIGQAHSND